MKIICIGRNYAEHAKEMNAPLPDAPLFFMKPETAVLKSGEPFYYPDFSKDIHFECELILKISKTGKHIAEEFAGSYYNEIGLGIDFTARDLQQQCKEKGTPWEIAKSFDHSAVVGSTFIHKEHLNLEGIEFHFAQNGEVKQRGNSNEMIFSFDQLIAYVSRFVTLKTGDLIYTGTPSGVGPIQIGDELTGFIGEQLLFKTLVR